MDIARTAQDYATQAHRSTNHRYDEYHYDYHLGMVAGIAEEFLPQTDFSTEEYPQIIAGAWCHDIIEDARETYNDVKKILGEEVAEIVFHLTNEKGRTRSERANDKYYAGIKSSDKACFVKCCDRLANMRYSMSKGSKMIEIYRREFPSFKGKLYTPGKFEAIWMALDAIALAPQQA